jgi:hypothetical protein
MSRDEVLNRISKLDVLYKELDVLDQEFNEKRINEIDYLIREVDLKKEIDKLFKI